MRRLALLAALLPLAISTAQADGLVDRALALWKKDDVYPALELAKKAVAADPKNADAHGMLSRCQMDLARFDEALASVAEAARLAPKIWTSLGRSYQAQVAFFYGDDEGCRTHLATIKPGPTTKGLPFLMKPDGMHRYRKPRGRYIIYVDEALKARGGHTFAASVMNVVYRSYTTFMPFKRNKKIVHRVYVFSTTRGYLQFNARRGSDASASVGRYARTHRILLINADPKQRPANKWGYTDDTIDTMFHEGFHQFAHQFVYNAPSWFEEGLAEYFGPSQLISSSRIRLGHFVKDDPAGFHTRYSRIKQVVNEGKPMKHVPFDKFMTMSDREFGDGSRQSVHYAQAWSVIHFLLHSRAIGSKGKKMVRGFFSALREGKTREAAFEEAFGKYKLWRLEELWVAYVKAL